MNNTIDILTAALARIANGDEACRCDHATIECCARQDEFCSRCIAAQALAETDNVNWRANLFHGGKSR